MHVVSLTGSPENRKIAELIWGTEYFPRKFHYSIDALNLSDRLNHYDVKHKVVKHKSKVKQELIYEGV